MKSAKTMSEAVMATDVIRMLCKQSEESMNDIATATGISASTLYCLCNTKRHSNQVDLVILDKIAKHFGYDITVFLGLDQYEKRITLTDDEKNVLQAVKKMTQPERGALVAFLKGVNGQSVERGIQVATEALKMNDRGIERVLETCDDLLSSGKYKRGK